MSERIQDWFPGWLKRHIQVCPHDRWPDPKSEDGRAFFAPFALHFARHAVTQVEAQTATDELAADPPAFVDGHLRAILRSILSARAAASEREERDRSLREADERRQAIAFRREVCQRWDALPEAERESLRDRARAKGVPDLLLDTASRTLLAQEIEARRIGR